MKLKIQKTSLLLAFVFMSLIKTLPGQSQLNLQQGLVAYYPFNGNANDESGFGNHGVVNGATLTQDRFGNGNSAYFFDGNDFVNIEDDISLRPEKITISVWINPIQLSSSMKIIGKSNYINAEDEQYALSLQNFGNYLATEFAIKRESNCNPGSGWQKLFGYETILSNVWLNITSAWGGYTMKLFYNGVLESIKVDAISGNIDDCIGGNFRIGLWWLNDNQFFKGSIDDVRIYNRALNEQEIQALFTENQPPQINEITNIFINPRHDGSGLVDVHFNLTGTSPLYNIALQASFDGGITYTVIPAAFLNGNTGPIAQGNNKHIVWDGLGSFPNTYSINTKLKITANPN